jgi:hypothetical protein
LAFIAEISTVGHYLLERPRRFAWVFILSALNAMGVDSGLANGCALLVPAILEIAMLPISLAGWGVREGAAVVAFGAIGLPAAQALGVSIAFGLIVAAVSTLGGVLWLADRRQVAQMSMDVRDEV